MKKFLSIILASVLMMSMAGCGNKAKQDSDMEYLKSTGTVKVGYTIINPLNYTDEQTGKLTGFETDFATAVFEKLGLKAEFQEIDWDSKEVELNSKNIDVIWNGMTITDERKESMSVTIPYLQNKQVLVTKKDNVAKYTDSIKGANVIAEAGSAGEELCTSDNEFFSGINFTAVQSQATSLMDVSAGTSDITVIDYIMAIGSVGDNTSFEDLAIIDKNFEGEEYGAAFRKGSDVTEKVNATMQEMAKDGTLKKIAEKYGLEDAILVK